MKQPVRCQRCGGHHLRRDCPMREHDEGNSCKVPRLQDQLEAENQQDKFVEAEGLGHERSKQMIERGTDLQNFEILMCNCICVFLCNGTPGTVLFQGGGECNTLVFTHLHDVYIVINRCEELKAKAPPSIWLCMFRQWGQLPMVCRAIRHLII